jgi:hypothetical protein
VAAGSDEVIAMSALASCLSLGTLGLLPCHADVAEDEGCLP